MDEIDEEANEIFKRELDERFEWTHEELRSSVLNGYTGYYLFKSANFEEFSSSAKMEVILELVKLDRRKGTTIPELIFKCCWYFPKKEALEKLLEVGKQTQTEKEVVKSVLEFTNNEGASCLISTFQMAVRYREKTDEYPSGQMMHDIEDSCIYMIDLAKRFNLDLKKTLNHTTKTGSTLFSAASMFSERITRQLLEENVQVNSVDHKFVSPFIRVRYIFSIFNLR